MNVNGFLVVIDPTTDKQLALDHAIESAKMNKGRLHLFQCVHYQHGDALEPNDEAKKATILAKYQRTIDALAEAAKNHGIEEVSVQLEWQETWSDAVVQSAKEQGSLMIFNTSAYHSRAERNDKTADYTLLRGCPCPVMLMHHQSTWERRRVLASVNLAALDQEHQDLNKKIINIAQAFKIHYNSEVFFVNSLSCAEASVNVADDEGDLLLVNAWPAFVEIPPSESSLTIDLDYVAQICGCDNDHVVVRSGNTVDVILEAAEFHDVDVIIAGTVGRTGIMGKVLGNTAEKLLDATTRDILTVS